MNRAGRLSIKMLAGAVAALAAASVAAPAFADDRYAAIVLNPRTGEVLLEDHADESRFPASLTKMMTLYMMFEAIDRGDISLSTRWTVSRRAAGQPPSRLGLRRGDTISAEQAIRALVVQSANDVAVTVAENLGGSEPRFAANMTARARALGLSNTRFVNASGLPDPRQQTTARDMARLSQALWQDFPQYYGFFQTEENAFRNRSGHNHNHLLGQVAGVDGIKTGYTRASGFNLASSAERDGQRVIVVVLGGETAAARDAQVAYLIEGAFEEFARRADPNAVTYASLPASRLDGQIQSGATMAGMSAPYPTYQNMVVETMAPSPAGERPTGQGDEDENSGEQE